LNRNGKLLASSPRNPTIKKRSRVPDKASVNVQYVASLQKELENEKYHLQNEAKLIKEIEELHKTYKQRLDQVNSERAKEKEIYKSAIIENDQKIEMQRERIRELQNTVQDLTNKNKHHEATIHMLEMTVRETETSDKTKVGNFETTIQQIGQQLQEQQTYAHNMKNENNNLKIQINQLTKTVEGQKAAYDNLRNQIADVYKQKQEESQKQQNYAYVPKVSVDMSKNRGEGYTNRSSSVSEEIEMGYFGGSSPAKAPMNSRWAKPTSEITRPAGAINSTSTPRLDQFTYKNALTRNNNKETSMMEKYCSNSVGQILNWMV
jgi:chromosome segregation ATPase